MSKSTKLSNKAAIIFIYSAIAVVIILTIVFVLWIKSSV